MKADSPSSRACASGWWPRSADSLSRRPQKAQFATTREGDARFAGQAIQGRHCGARYAEDGRPSLHLQFEVRQRNNRRQRTVGATGALTAAGRRIVGLLFVISSCLALMRWRGRVKRMCSPKHHIVAATGGGFRRRECQPGQQHCCGRSPARKDLSRDVHRHSPTDRMSAAGNVKCRRL
jgi:hypothetical protein